jgi:phage terminase large subunit-like protein
VFNESLNMVKASAGLSNYIDPVPSRKRMNYPREKATYAVLSSEVQSKEGYKWHFLLCDELHAWPNRALWDCLIYGGTAFHNSLLLTLSTAGYDRESIGYEQYLYAKSVVSAKRVADVPDTSFFAYVAEAGEDDDWSSPATWAKANPSLGATVLPDDLAREFAEAESIPTKENAFRRYRLNQWTQQETRWLSVDHWDRCGIPLRPIDARPCFGGLDLASTTDLAAFALACPDADGTYDVEAYFWLPEEAAKQREKSNRVRFTEWMRAGLITKHPGRVIDQERIRRDLNAIRTRRNVVEIAADRWNAVPLLNQLEGDGWNVVPYGQGFRDMSPPTKELESLILSDRIRHAGNPVLRFCFGNVQIETDAAGNIKPSKRRSPDKIDGIVALAMALGRAILKSQTPSVYESRGILVI